MIFKLRLRLIKVSMISLFLVLALIGGGSAWINHRRITEEADKTLQLLMENDGMFPKEYGSVDMENKSFMSPELPFESRYFSVRMSAEGDVEDVDIGQIAAVSRETAIEYARTIFHREVSGGFIGNYRYGVQELKNGDLRIVFLDCRRLLQNFRNSYLIFCEVALFGILAVGALIAFFSQRMVRPIAESYEKQKRFITDAGHEIKTPLAIIDADANVLGIEIGDNEWVNDIKRQTRRLVALTNDLICLSRMEEEKVKLEAVEVSLSDVAGQVAEDFQVMARTRKKQLRLEIQPQITMKGDEKMLRQLVSILLDNAVKYSLPEGEIVLTLKRQGHGICLSVCNPAEPLKKSDLDHLFDRFYRTDESRNSETGGHGIGLSIASAVVTAHRGKISASAKDGKSLMIKAVFPA